MTGFAEETWPAMCRDFLAGTLKHSAADASEAELRAKADEGVAKLRQYASDPSVPDLAKDTELHLILFQFRGFDLHRLEEIP